MLMSATMALLGTVGFDAKYFEPEQSLLLSRYPDEQQGALKLCLRLLQRLGDVKDQRRSRSVVHGAVVNPVSVDGLTNAQVINVGREYNVLVLQLGVAAGKLGDDVVRLNVRMDNLRARLDADS